MSLKSASLPLGNENKKERGSLSRDVHVKRGILGRKFTSLLPTIPEECEIATDCLISRIGKYSNPILALNDITTPLTRKLGENKYNEKMPKRS